MNGREPVRVIRRITKAAVSAIVDQYRSLRLLRDRRMAVLAAANILDTMSGTIFVPFLPTLAEELGASPFLIGLIFSVPAVVGAVVSSPAGYLSDRLGRRPLIWSGVTLSAFPVMAIAFISSPLLLIVLRALNPFFRAFVGPVTNAYLGDTYEEDGRGRAFGVYQTTGMIGAAIGSVIGGILASIGGIRLPFFVLGIGTLAGGLLLFLLLPGVQSREEEKQRTSKQSILPEFSWEALSLFLTVPALAWFVTAFINEFGTNMLNPIFPLLLRETVGGGPAYAGTVYSMIAVGMLLFLPLGGQVADRVGRVRVLTVTPIGWCIVTVGLALATAPWQPVVLMFLGGILSAFAAPASFALRYEIAPDGREATFSGMTGTVSSLGSAVGPLVAGTLLGLWGVQATAIAAGLVWLVAVPLFVLFIPETVSETE